MITKFTFPKPSANVENATLTAWHKKEDDQVTEGEIVAEITTDKGEIEVEAPASGVLRRIIAEEGSMLPVGYIIGLIGEADDPLPDVTAENEAILAAFAEQTSGTGSRGKREGRGRKRVRIRATPAARRLAREHGLDLAEVATKNGAEAVDETMVQAFIDDH